MTRNLLRGNTIGPTGVVDRADQLPYMQILAVGRVHRHVTAVKFTVRQLISPQALEVLYGLNIIRFTVVSIAIT